MSRKGLMIAAPSSGAGKTTITLGLLRALSLRGAVVGAKSGPDYIDPKFHEAATGQPCVNLDAWAMSPQSILRRASGDAPLIVEAAMGLFDGAPPDGAGSAADLAKILGLPVVLVLDCAKAAQSIAAVVQGFARFDPDVIIAGIILNRVGSDRHETMIKTALEAANGPPVLGVVPRQDGLSHPSRHLGLVQAQERRDLDDWLTHVADVVSRSVDLDALPFGTVSSGLKSGGLRPPAQRIAVAQDAAFAFSYPHMLHEWSHAGAEIKPFSPLNNEAVPDADLIFLPGGYPELYAGQIAQADAFLNSIKKAAQTTEIYGECGGYMVLGEGLTDADGNRHRMLGLLSLETSFATRKLHLGYRHLQADKGPFKGNFSGHEFHYATTISATGDALFKAQDAEGRDLPDMGLRRGKVSGSFAHIIDQK